MIYEFMSCEPFYRGAPGLFKKISKNELPIVLPVFLFLQPSDDDTVSLHSQVSETARLDAHILLTKLDTNKGVYVPIFCHMCASSG